MFYLDMTLFRQVQSMEWTFENLEAITSQGELKHLAELMSKKHFDLVINLSMRNGGARRVSSLMTHGYRTRRLTIDYSVPLITDVKCANLLVEALHRIGRAPPPMKTHTDCMSSHKLIKLPGFIDTHVHVREPGSTHKEDYSTCTAAALAGGVTLICAMPNTYPPIIDEESLNNVKKLAKDGARCDYAVFMGATNDNFSLIPQFAPQVAGLKMYLNETFTTLKLNDLEVWNKHLEHWPRSSPLCVHAESQTTAAIILMAMLLKRPVHICHVARKEEILIIKEAKRNGINITCEVCPHHLFLTKEDADVLGERVSQVRPHLGTKEDQEALWQNLAVIDCFATDHAPHTFEEKNSENPPPGFPGLETLVPLLLNAVNEKKLTIEDVIDKLYRNPKRIFNLPDQLNTYVEVDLEEEWVIPKSMLFTKCQWTPFAGKKVKGSVHRVVLRGEVAYVDGQVLVPPGYGQNVREWDPIRHHIHKYNDGQTNKIFKELLSEEKPVQTTEVLEEKSVTTPLPRVRSDHLTEMGPAQGHCRHSQHHGLVGRHITSVDIFNKDMLNDLFTMAQKFKSFSQAKGRHVDYNYMLNGKIMALMFYEVSTRTKCSFAAAMERLGGRPIYMDQDTSSVKKGESLHDSVTVMASYAHVVVLRHPEPGSVFVSSAF